MAFAETAYYVEGRPMSGVVCGACGAELTVQEAEKDACGVCSWRISMARAQEARAFAVANDPDLKPWPPEALLW